MEHMDLFDIRSCWGNLTFDFVVGPSVGNLGAILCVWDINMFHKENSTVSDYFIAIMGKWLPNDKNLLIISVYAPQELSEKRMLWQYLVHVIEGGLVEVKDKKDKAQLLKNSLKKLAAIDSSLDKGDATSDALEDRLNTMNNLTNLERMKSLELAQKAKIKWSIKGDENSNFFHGIINKQCNNLAIRGIIIDGEWIEDPMTVKNEFLAHFRDRFGTPCKYCLTLDMNFPNKLSID
ncbi:hypothetical protein Tco_1453350 [Tanacetum coccineum]